MNSIPTKEEVAEALKKADRERFIGNPINTEQGTKQPPALGNLKPGSEIVLQPIRIGENKA